MTTDMTTETPPAKAYSHAQFRKIRLELGLSQTGMAELLRITQATVSKKESGNCPVTDLETAMLDLVLNCPQARGRLGLRDLKKQFVAGRNGPRSDAA